MLGALAEAVRPSFVARRMMKVTESAKAPGAHTAFLEWLSDAVKDFGANMFPVQAIVKFCLVEMDNKTAQVRTGAINVLGQLYHQVGPPFASLVFAEDLKPQLRTMIEAEFEKVGYDPTAMKNTARQVKDGEEAAPAESGSLIPRQDLMNLVGRDIVQRLNNNDGKNAWQTRKAAIEDVIAAAERASHYLEASKSLAEVLKALRGRLSDSQSNLKPMAAGAIAHLVNSVDAASVPKLLRLVGEGLMGGVSDNKKQMRDAAVEAIEKCVTIDGAMNTAAVDVLLPALATALANPNGRLELLTWFQKAIDVVSADASELAAPLVACMQDKTAVIRSAAEACLTSLAARRKVSRNSVESVVRDLPPAARRTLEGPVSRMFEGLGGGAAAPAAEAPTPAAPAAAAPSKAAPESKLVRGAKLGRSQSTITKVRPGASAREASSIRPPAEAKQEVSAASDSTALRANPNKQRRLDDFARANWPSPPEEPRNSEFDDLRDVWTPCKCDLQWHRVAVARL
jgi:cytoskeleton-associated protein 5